MEVTAATLIARLARAFPRQPVPRDTFELYLVDLSEVPVAVLEPAVTHLIRTSEWFPTVSAIREACAENVLELPSEAAALAQVEARIRWARQGDEREGAAPAVHALVKEALDRVGGYPAFRGSEEPSRVRRQFGVLYGQLREGALRQARIAPAIGPPPTASLAA